MACSVHGNHPILFLTRFLVVSTVSHVHVRVPVSWMSGCVNLLHTLEKADLIFMECLANKIDERILPSCVRFYTANDPCVLKGHALMNQYAYTCTAADGLLKATSTCSPQDTM